MSARTSAVGSLLLCLLLAGCAGGGKLGLNSKDGLTASASARGMGKGAAVRGSRSDPAGTGDPRCNSGVAARSVSEFDTNGDGNLNVRKVYLLRAGAVAGSAESAQLICREADINGDGKKDLIRVFDDDGKALREDADRNFDGKIDLTTTFQSGEIVSKSFDQNYDGTMDGKTFFEAGRPVRIELDLRGLSTPQQWRPTQWQYFEEGGVVRIGTDLDGDSKIDRWERDQTHDETVGEGAEGEGGEGAEGEGAEGEGAEGDAEGETAEG